MHKASNDTTKGAEYLKPTFKEDYNQPEGTQFTPPTRAKHVEQPPNQPTEDTAPPEEDTTPNTEPQENQPNPEPERKTSREERNLKSDLGNYWKCTDQDPHYDGPIARQLRIRVTGLKEEETEPTQEDFWTLEDDKDAYFQKWKQTYTKIHKEGSFESLQLHFRV